VKTDAAATTFGPLLISTTVSLALSNAAHAQQPQVLTIQETVVTSRAREEALLDVPISLSLVSGDMIDESGITNLEDLSTTVPNFTVTQDPIGDKINIRGIFTSEVASLEQSVSTFVDGVNRGRGTQARLQFLDLERVEVLRGPQGTLFGKNTVGGALNLITQAYHAIRRQLQCRLRPRVGGVESRWIPERPAVRVGARPSRLRWQQPGRGLYR
jgi:outer membrane receptor protein involved in Fe transport